MHTGNGYFLAGSFLSDFFFWWIFITVSYSLLHALLKMPTKHIFSIQTYIFNYLLYQKPQLRPNDFKGLCSQLNFVI